VSDTSDTKLDDFGKLVLRCLVGALLLVHGVVKIERGIEWMRGPLTAFHLPFFVAYGVYVGEVLAPVFLILGYLTRPAAFVVMMDLVMAIVLVAHKKMSIVTQGGAYGLEAELFFLFGGLVILLLGPGRYGLTRSRRDGHV